MMYTFTSKAAGSFTMLTDTAQSVLSVIGKELGQRGVITAAEVPKALAKLEAAAGDDRRHASQLDSTADTDDADDGGKQPDTSANNLSLHQRAYPLIAMLREADKQNKDVMWEA